MDVRISRILPRRLATSRNSIPTRNEVQPPRSTSTPTLPHTKKPPSISLLYSANSESRKIASSLGALLGVMTRTVPTEISTSLSPKLD